MYSTVSGVSLGTQLKMPICLPGFLDHCHNGPFQMLTFMFCCYCMGYRLNDNIVQCPEASGSQLYDVSR